MRSIVVRPCDIGRRVDAQCTVSLRLLSQFVLVLILILKYIRGVSFNFNYKAIKEFLEKFELDLICRGHQVVEDGYEFHADRSLVTIFSAPNYCGEFDNAAAVMTVNEELVCSFQIFRPEWHRNRPAVALSPADVSVELTGHSERSI